MIRVVHLIPTLGGGGSEYQLAQLVTRLDRRRFRVTVACLRLGGVYVAKLKEAGVDLIDLAIKSSRASSLRNLGKLGRFIRWLREEEVHLVHAWLSVGCRIGTPLARLARVPVVIYSSRGMGMTKSSFERAEERAMYPLLDRIVVNSMAQRDRLVARGGPRGKIVVIRNGVDLRRFSATGPREAARSELGIPEEIFVVGAVGSFQKVKGQHVLMEAASRVLKRTDKVRFILVGEGLERPRLEALCSNLGISNYVIFTGYRSDVERIYPAFDVLALPSLSEGFPNVVLESFASGVPVVATRVGGVPEVVEDGRTGWLVPPGDAESLAKGLLTAIWARKELPEMGSIARRRVSEFTMERYVSETEALYETLLAEKGVNVGNRHPTPVQWESSTDQG